MRHYRVAEQEKEKRCCCSNKEIQQKLYPMFLLLVGIIAIIYEITIFMLGYYIGKHSNDYIE
ncbi:MAG: hypothetical protein ATN32_06590 [Candidatus Epulonipiscium fishelsonii]|nr:MAG: hypothetical protein ATN32_06590 [Epulopiscium sp. AS2M-Bin002]